MKKRLLSTLLVMVIILTMTACVATTDTQSVSSEQSSFDIIELAVEETTSAKKEYKLKVRGLPLDIIEDMSPEDVSTFFDEMVNISKTETLCSQDMYQLGLNFHDIWWYNNANCNQAELEEKSYETFINIYTQAIEQKISLDEIYSWTFTPVPEVLYTYFSSNNFSSTMNIACAGFYALEEDDAIRVAEAFFKNPLFATNTSFALSALNYPCDIVQDMGWAHLTKLSQSTDSVVSENTYRICQDIFTQAYIVNSADKFSEIAKNIMENPHYDFVEKYTFFYKDVMDENISNMAFESLFEMAKTANEETSALIQQVVSNLYGDAAANELLTILEKN